MMLPGAPRPGNKVREAELRPQDGQGHPRLVRSGERSQSGDRILNSKLSAVTFSLALMTQSLPLAMVAVTVQILGTARYGAGGSSKTTHSNMIQSLNAGRMLNTSIAAA